jgi:hypothetical protein
MRFRYFLSLNYPLKTFTASNSLLYAAAYNEIFLNTESSVFDRNRLFGGIGWKLNNKLKFEVGYMNQFFENSGIDQINLITYFYLSLFLFINFIGFDLSRVKIFF